MNDPYRIIYNGLNFSRTYNTAIQLAELLREMLSVRKVEVIVKSEDIDKIKAENGKLREALAFYADGKNWEGFGKAHLLENSVADEVLKDTSELEGI